MIDQFKEILNKIQNKEEKSQENTNIKELIKFDSSILEKYPSIELKYLLYKSNFGVSSPNNNETIKQGSISIFSHENKIRQLINQLEDYSKKSEYDKYGKVDRRKTINNPSTNKEHIGNKKS